VCGNGTVELGEQCDDGNLKNGDGCSSICRIEPIRISGETQVVPSQDTWNLMKRDRGNGGSLVKASVQLCIASTGRVAEARMLRSTGYVEYDQELLAAIRTWRYQPYTLDGNSKVCTLVTFKYMVE
jgi:TonB family protein